MDPREKPLAYLSLINEVNGFKKEEVKSLRMKIRNYHRRDRRSSGSIWSGSDIASSFSWSDTKEGYDFWSEVSAKIDYLPLPK